jgi:hypothetical protein
MPRFLIEVPHDGTTTACVRAVEAFLRTGSHFLTHADWGCKDGDHRAWVVLEVDSREEARNVIPPVFQAQAKVVQLNAFTMMDLEHLLRQHNL